MSNKLTKRAKTSFWLALFLSLVLVVQAEAQTLIIRYYIIPVEQVGNNRGPEYLKWRFGTGTLDVEWSCKDFGATNQMLCAVNAEQSDHDILLSKEDVVKIPQNLDSTVSAQALGATRTALEDLGIPGNWVNTNHTYREVVRFVAGLFLFAQRHAGLHDGQQIKPDNINLNQTWSNLPLAWRQNLAATADTFGYDTSGVTASTTIRVIMRSLADQWGDTPIEFGFTTL